MSFVRIDKHIAVNSGRWRDGESVDVVPRNQVSDETGDLEILNHIGEPCRRSDVLAGRSDCLLHGAELTI